MVNANNSLPWPYIHPLTSKLFSFYETRTNKTSSPFFHLSSGKLLKILNYPNPDKATNYVKWALEELSTACISCKTFRTKSYRFGVPVQSVQVRFNEKVWMDLLCLEKANALCLMHSNKVWKRYTVRNKKGRRNMAVIISLLKCRTHRPSQQD